MLYYLAGPMTGYPEYNWPAFEYASDMLRSDSWDIISPHENDHEETLETRGSTLPYAGYLADDFKLLLDCGGIILLQGWTASRGAMAEFQYAVTADMEIWLFESLASDKGYYRVTRMDKVTC